MAADPTDTARLQMLQLVQVVGGPAVGAATAEEAMVVPLIATALARHSQVVGMTRVVAVAQMMTEMADIAVEASTIAMELVEVAATWSR